MLDIVTLGKLALGVGSIVALMLLGTWSRLYELSDRSFTRIATVFAVASRLTVFAVLFLILKREPQSDVFAYYYPQAGHALLGQVPYRDFYSSYAPLFPYLMAGAVFLWNTPRSIVLFAVLVELVSLPLWLRVARDAVGERKARLATLLYLLSPLPLVNVAINGQNQVFISLLLALSLFFLSLGRPFASGLWIGASLVSIKILGVLAAPPPFLGAGARKGRWLLGFVLFPLVIYGALVALGVDVLTPLRAESKTWSSGNLPYLLRTLGVGFSDASTTLLVGATLAGVSLLGLWSRAGDAKSTRIYLAALLLLTFLLFSKKAYTNYLVMGFFPICLLVAARSPGLRELGAFGLFGLVAVLEPSLWHRWMWVPDPALLFSGAGPTVSRAKLVIFFSCEALLLASYIVLLVRGYRLVREGPRELEMEREASWQA